MAYSTPDGGSIQATTNGVPPIASLTAASATSAVGAVLDGVTVRQNAVISVTSSAGVSAGSVQLLGSLDGVNFHALGSAISTTSAATTTAVTVTNALVRYVKASIATTITGGTVTVSVGLAG